MCTTSHKHKLVGIIVGAGVGKIRFNKREAGYDDFAVDSNGGYYTDELSKGTYDVYYRLKGSGVFVQITDPNSPIEISALAGTCRQDFSVSKIAFYGRVLDKQGNPVSKQQRVSIGEFLTWTAPDGRFAAALPSGSYSVRANDLKPLEVIWDGVPVTTIRLDPSRHNSQIDVRAAKVVA